MPDDICHRFILIESMALDGIDSTSVVYAGVEPGPAGSTPLTLSAAAQLLGVEALDLDFVREQIRDAGGNLVAGAVIEVDASGGALVGDGLAQHWEASQAGRSLRLVQKGNRGSAKTCDPVELGIAIDFMDRFIAASRQAGVWIGAGGSPVVWQLKPMGGEQNWSLAERLAALAAQKEAAQVAHRHGESKRSRQLASEDGFVNPYNFVPLPSTPPRRGAPNHHSVLGRGLLSGRITVTYEAVTRLLLRGAKDAKGNWSPLSRPIEHNGGRVDRPIVPGSSMAGVVRALHETWTGSCLRVFDSDFLPAYREPTNVKTGWRLALVTSSGNQRDEPVSVRLCEEETPWVEASWLPAVTRGRLSCSDRFTGTITSQQTGLKRIEPGQEEDVQLELEVSQGRPQGRSEPGVRVGLWVPLVTSAGARDPEKRYHVAMAQLSAVDLTVDDEVLALYRKKAAGSADAATRRKGKEPELAVKLGNDVIGHRQEVCEELGVGDVIWVKLGHGRVEDISRAAIWRSAGKIPAAVRASGFLPCDDPEDLCPSCSLFGMADVRDDSQAGSPSDGRQRAYRGHVRFSDAWVNGDLDTVATTLPPQGQPRPGAGNLYLEHLGQPPARGSGDRALKQWGSSQDDGSPRRIRGRKRYWSHSSETLLLGNGNEEMTSRAHLVSKGAKLTTVVAFDVLSPEQLGALLLSLAPNLAQTNPELSALRASIAGLPEDEQPLVLQVGGGKPWSMGSLKDTAISVEVFDASRYTESGDTTSSAVPADYVAKFVASVEEPSTTATGPGLRTVKDTWPALLAMLQHERTPGVSVKYPPDVRANRDFRFDFWKASAGGSEHSMKLSGRYYVPSYQQALLPEPDSDQWWITWPPPLDDKGHR